MRMDAQVTFRNPDYLPDLLWPRLDSNRFDGCVAVQSDPGDDDWLLDLASEYDYIRAVVLFADTPQDLDRLQRHSKFRAVRWTETQSPDFFRELERRDLALEISSDPVSIVEVAPDLRIATPASAGLIPVHSSHYVKVTARHANEMFDRFGPTRMMFGSDWPNCLAEGSWKLTLAKFTQALGPRTMDLRSLMLGDTAASFYRL